MLTAQTLANALKFLERTTLQGAETPAFNQVISALGGELARLQSEEQKQIVAQQELHRTPANRAEARRQAKLQEAARKMAGKNMKQAEKATNGQAEAAA